MSLFTTLFSKLTAQELSEIDAALGVRKRLASARPCLLSLERQRKSSDKVYSFCRKQTISLHRNIETRIKRPREGDGLLVNICISRTLRWKYVWILDTRIICPREGQITRGNSPLSLTLCGSFQFL